MNFQKLYQLGIVMVMKNNPSSISDKFMPTRPATFSNGGNGTANTRNACSQNANAAVNLTHLCANLLTLSV